MARFAVTLTWFEIFEAVQVGGMRRITGLKNALSEPYGSPADAWSADINGALGERAVAKHLGVYWQPVIDGSDGRLGDVDGNHVRATGRREGGLILHARDPDDGPYWLAVTAALPEVWLYGPTTAAAGRELRFWREDIPRPAFIVPQRELVAA